MSNIYLFPTKSLLRPTDLSALKNELPLSLLSFKRLFFFFLIFHFCPAFILPCAPLEGAVKASYKSDSDWTCYPLRAPHFPTCLAFALALFTAWIAPPHLISMCAITLNLSAWAQVSLSPWNLPWMSSKRNPWTSCCIHSPPLFLCSTV